MHEVTMPKLSDSMEVGKIVAWQVAEGDAISAGDTLAQIESDKAVMDLECFHDGVVAKIVHQADEEVAVGDVIALVGDAGEEATITVAPTHKAAAPAIEAPAQVEKPAAPERKEAAAVEREEAPAPPAVPARPQKRAPRREGERVPISPYARKLAQDAGVEYATITGTGPDGRIIARDIEAALKAEPKPPTPARMVVDHVEAKPSADEELAPITLAEGEADVEDASFRLKTQVRLVSASKHVIPHFYVTASVDADALLAKKDALKESVGATVTHLVMAASLRALKEHPEINRSYDRGKVVKWRHVNLGLAVDTDEGLNVVVIREAEDLSLADLVARTRELVEKARAGTLSGEDRRHPTFTITNLGMFGVEDFAPIINPPSSITLAVASALPAPVVRGDAMYLGKVMRLTASCDHRIIEGAAAARFMRTLGQSIEAPDRLVE